MWRDNEVALRDFWISVRAAAGSISPKVTVDSPSLDAARIEHILARATLWLTPAAVRGFDEGDFGFLSPGERQALSSSVEGFRLIASQVPPKGPATDDQIQAAMPHFRRILEILRPDKFGDDESFHVGKILEQQLENRFPEWVRDFKIETGYDANGDPAIWIWVVVDDDAVQQKEFPENTRSVRNTVEEILRELGVTRWPYVRFRTVSEQPASQEHDQQ